MADHAPDAAQPEESGAVRAAPRMPRWVPRAVIVLWAGYIASLVLRWTFDRLSGFLILLLVSLFMSLALEPGVNRLVQRGWRRGRATALILLAVVLVTGLFVGAIGALVGQQIADLLQNTDLYVNRIVKFLNNGFGTKIDAASVNKQIQDPQGGFQKFIASQSDNALRLSVAALTGLFHAFSVLFFTYYLVADGPKLRRLICSRLPPARQVTVLKTWELALEKTGGYLYSRALLAGFSAMFHWVAFAIIGVPAPIPMALWVGIISQFIPVVGAYVAGALPVVVALVNPGSSPLRALIALIVIVVYQQVQDYTFALKITSRTLKMHPATAFGSALAGAAVLGPVGAILALPGAAMLQAILGEMGSRHGVVSSPLTSIEPRRLRKRRRRRTHDGD